MLVSIHLSIIIFGRLSSILSEKDYRLNFGKKYPNLITRYKQCICKVDVFKHINETLLSENVNPKFIILYKIQTKVRNVKLFLSLTCNKKINIDLV